MSPPPPYSVTGSRGHSDCSQNHVPPTCNTAHSRCEFASIHTVPTTTNAFSLNSPMTLTQRESPLSAISPQTLHSSMRLNARTPPLSSNGNRGSSNIDINRESTTVTLQESTPVADHNCFGPRAFESRSQHVANASDTSSETVFKAPASRRAVSTGAIESTSGHLETTASLVRHGFYSGLSIPPPPPGPPPTGIRSQSLSRSTEARTITPQAPTTSQSRQRLMRPTRLETVPPTPADWIDGFHPSQPAQSSPKSSVVGTAARTFSAVSSQHEQPMAGRHRRGSSSGPLYRSPAIRNSSSRGLRERRSESRNDAYLAEPTEQFATVRDLLTQTRDSAKMADLILPFTAQGVARRRASARSSPQLTHGFERDEKITESVVSDRLDSATNPNSMPPKKGFSSSVSNSPPPLGGLRYRQDPHSNHLTLGPRLTDVAPIPALRKHRLEGIANTPSDFVKCAVERHRRFIEDEAEAQDDAERLRLFLTYVATESEVRRDQYQRSLGEQLINIEMLVIRLFQDSKDTTQEPGLLFDLENTSSQQRLYRTQDSAEFRSQPHSALTLTKGEQGFTVDPYTRVNLDKCTDYLPSLSPIASTSVVTGKDEMDSRGRAPSRWWESESRDSSRSDRFKVLGRSKRESKYMGLNPELDSVVKGQSFTSESPSEAASKKEDGLATTNSIHSQDYQRVREPKLQTHTIASTTSDLGKFDVSLLITLPPPFPRHYPAILNSHPSLKDIRDKLRRLSDMEDAKAIRHLHDVRVSETSERCMSPLTLGGNLQHSAAAPETNSDNAMPSFNAPDLREETEPLRRKFDLFQSTLFAPLHSHLAERISQATHHFDHICAQLEFDAQTNSPNLPQEEGDGQPELLEKLTLLKWLFETRENLHRELYQLLNERNDRYQELVMFPYQQTSDVEKIEDVETFFQQDSASRATVFSDEVLMRHLQFLQVVESHVNRGVETQTSAFWDIAPNLLRLLQEMPIQQLQELDVLIPLEEINENPIYSQHPLRYLHSVVCHAEASSRQFIDSQISLWCLLQEVREGIMGAKSKAASTRPPLFQNGENMKETETRASIEDLKEKVAVIEGQWVEGLGSTFAKVKCSIKDWLIEHGGWDEADDE